MTPDPLSGRAPRPAGSPSRRPPRVTVLGSLNTDISLSVPHLPAAGETVLGTGGARLGAGGKGANQAVAAARLGAVVRMAGCTGDDPFARIPRAALAAEGVDAAGVRTVAGEATGVALITVDPAGENAIAVAPGANAAAGDAEVDAAFAGPADVLILCAEIPARVLAQAIRRARDQAVLTVLNLAPVPERGRDLVAAGPDWLVVNTTEAAALTGEEVTGLAGAEQLVRALAGPGGLGAAHAVITAGAEGAAFAGLAGAGTVPPFAVTAVDTVGAGDAFVGALAVALGCGLADPDAVRAACAAGATAATGQGAQAALPAPADVAAATGLTWPLPG
jgi:ribokinase